MKFFWVLVINLILLVQVSRSHTIPPTIIAKSEPDDDVVVKVNQDDNSISQVYEPELDDDEQSDPSGLLAANADPSIEPLKGAKDDELVFAHVMYRHGERDIPKHIELTNAGKMHLFELGEYFHKRYAKLVGDKYDQEKVYILSTEHDRAIMSAQANLAGMFEPKGDEIWHKKILWQPIPVHTLPTEMDNILRPRYDGRCPRYDEMYDWYIKESPEAMAMVKKYGHLFEFWAEKSGKKVKHIEHAFSIYKKLLSKKAQNQTIPAWAEEACAPGGPMEEIAKVVYLIRAKPNLVRVRSGFLLKEMLERFRAKKKGKLDPDRALWMYSAHSSTITTLLNGLGFNLPIPEHGFSFHFEMYKTPKDRYYLQLFLRQPGDENPKAEEIKECGEKCSLSKFYEIYDKLIPDSFEKECGVKKDDPNVTDKPTDKPKTDKPTDAPKPTEAPGSGVASINGNGSVISIVLCTLWFIRKLFGKA